MASLYRNNDGTRIIIKVIDTDTNEQLFEVRDRNWMNISEFFTEHYITEIMRQKYGDDHDEYYPNITAYVIGSYSV